LRRSRCFPSLEPEINGNSRSIRIQRWQVRSSLVEFHRRHRQLVSQNAGSSNPGIYYQVGGGGLNLFVEQALGPDQTDQANHELVEAYDAKFGAGAWSRDQNAATPPLTSLFVPVDAAKCAQAGGQLVGMIYSVGPQVTSAGITDEAQYRSIYSDAFAAVVDANARGERIAAVRITMLSTGIYATGNPTGLFDTSARLILDAIVQAAAAAPEARFPQTVLVNNKTNGGGNKEVDCFTHAAEARGLKVDRTGFDLTVKTLR
jgi:hypothetical protein